MNLTRRARVKNTEQWEEILRQTYNLNMPIKAIKKMILDLLVQEDEDEDHGTVRD